VANRRESESYEGEEAIQPSETGQRADDGKVGDPAMSKEVAVRAERKSEQTFDREKLHLARKVEVGMKKKSSIQEGSREGEEIFERAFGAMGKS